MRSLLKSLMKWPLWFLLCVLAGTGAFFALFLTGRKETWIAVAATLAGALLLTIIWYAVLQKKLEASLSGMEETLTRIRVEMAKTAAEKENYLKEMESLDEKLDQVLAGILPVKQRLNDTLNRRAEQDV